MGNFSLITFLPYNLPFVSFERIREKKNFTLFTVTVTSSDFRFSDSRILTSKLLCRWLCSFIDYSFSFLRSWKFKFFTLFPLNTSTLAAAELNEMNAFAVVVEHNISLDDGKIHLLRFHSRLSLFTVDWLPLVFLFSSTNSPWWVGTSKESEIISK